MEEKILIQALEDINDREGYLSEENIRKVAGEFRVPLSRVYSIATFYNAFSLKPQGRHKVCVCVGTACHVRGADRVLEKMKEKLEIGENETTKDGSYSLKAVNCLGACALGPLVVIDGEYYGKATQDKVEKILKKYE